MAEFGLTAGQLESLAKGDVRKIAIAYAIKKRTVVGNEWIARELAMGVASRVSRYCSEGDRRQEIRKLVQRVEKSISKDRPL